MTDERERWTIPWTAEEIAVLERWQSDRKIHPFTCNGGLHWKDHRHDHEVKLVPKPEGLVCPECGRVQTEAF